MALINDPASRPAPMWAVVRFLAAEKRPVAVERAKNLLTPPGLVGDDHKMFEWAVDTLKRLRLAEETPEGYLRLTGPAAHLGVADYGAFTGVLRDAVLAPELNSGLGDDDSQVGARDLTRALCWFLSLDPTGESVGLGNYPRLQLNVLSPVVGKAIENNNRWNYFKVWAPALGLGAAALPVSGDASHLVPDCTQAVKQVAQASWGVAETVSAVEVLDRLRAALPVLPGGAYSTAVGVTSPGDTVAGPALSFALLRGADEGWWSLKRDADAMRFLSIHDPDRPSSPHSFSSITIFEDLHG